MLVGGNLSAFLKERLEVEVAGIGDMRGPGAIQVKFDGGT
jgi:hypothetical protein